MDFGGHEEEIGMPMPVSYDTIHESSKLKLLSTVSNGGGGEEIQQTSPEPAGAKKGVRYRECLKNHAASIGGHAVDGCGDFMPSGEEGTLEALKCAACGCHRNFHRREVEGEPYCLFCKDGSRKSRSAFLPITPHGHGHAPFALPLPPHMAAFGSSSSGGEAEEHDHMNAAAVLGMAGAAMGGAAGMPMKKRFRTKFTQDQKDKMFAFAEKLGWRIQKHDEAGVQQFCNEAGVKRHVLKVWMHNNKHTLGKKV